MSGDMVNLNGNRIVDPLVHLTFHIVPGGEESVEVERLYVAHVVSEVVAPIFMPFAGQITRRDGHLRLPFGVQIRGADGSVVRDPVRGRSKEIGDRTDGISTMGQEFLFG